MTEIRKETVLDVVLEAFECINSIRTLDGYMEIRGETNRDFNIVRVYDNGKVEFKKEKKI